MNHLNNDTDVGIEVRTIGDSRGYLWKIIIDRDRGLGKIEKVSGLADTTSSKLTTIDGSVHALNAENVVSDDMQKLTSKIESRFEAA
ncbi:MAG: hypothetical protein DHS20C09_01340 [marine bacterium B5-7]|nr:MAG: hypothetical protein DHS20C09_01340 [marine bacterium B5-7]